MRAASQSERPLRFALGVPPEERPFPPTSAYKSFELLNWQNLAETTTTAGCGMMSFERHPYYLASGILSAAKAGNRASYCPFEGYRVSSVASLEMAAGLLALSAMDVPARELLPPSRKDHITTREASGSGSLGRSTGGIVAMSFAGTAVSPRKHAEIMFGGVAASCVSSGLHGAEGVVTSTSRRPN